MSAIVTGNTPPVNLSHVQWRAAEWLLAFGPLTSEIVMDYFVLSPFFDRTSNNATLRMQMMFSRGGMEGVDEQAELSKFVGTEYVVAQAHPPSLFVIHKRERTSPSEVTTTGMYYVLNDNIYQSPSLYTVINERILTSLHALSSSLSLIKERKPHWTPESLYQWDIKPPPASALSSAGPDEVVSEHDNHKKGTADLKRSAGDIDEIDSIGLAAGTAAVDDGASDDDDDPPRPASAFNPLLFRALQTVASSLPDPPPAPVEPTRPNAVRFGTNDQLDGEDKKPATSSVPSASTGDKGAGPAQHHEAVQDSKRIKLVSTGKR